MASQDPRETGHGFGPPRGTADQAGRLRARSEANLSREMGELTTEIRHLNGSLDRLNAKLDKQDATLRNHAERIVRLEQGPTRGEIAAVDADLGARLTHNERRVAVIVGVCVVLGTLVQVALGAAKLIGGAP